MSKKHVQWLYEELPALVDAGVLPAESADKLRQHYGAVDPHDGRRLLMMLFGILGAVLIGGGIILLLAHNWDQLSRPVRTVFSLAPLVTAQALALWVLLAGRDSTGWREGIAAFWTLAIGIAISLVAQTYNLGGDFSDFILAWSLLGLPVIYLLRSGVAAGLYWVGVTTWAVNARVSHGMELWFWPLLALAVPHLWRAMRADRYHPRVGWLGWVLVLSVSVGIGAGLVDHLSDYWILIYASLFSVMWLAGRQWFSEGKGLWQQPLQSFGAVALLVLGVMLTCRWPWRDLTGHLEWWHLETRTPLFWLRLAVAAIWPAAAMCLWGLALRRRDVAGAVAGLMPVLAAAGFLPLSEADRDFILPLMFDVFLLAVSVAIIVAGVRNRRLGVVNGGMLVLSALIVAQFFNSHLDFLVRGLAFVAVGVGFLVTNLWLIKRTKVAQ